MNDQIEQLFREAKKSEVELPKAEFMADLDARLEANASLSQATDTVSGSRRRLSERYELPSFSYDWITFAAVILSVVVVFIASPISFWLNAIPHLSLGVEVLVLLSFGMLAAAMSCFWLFEKDRI